MMPLETSLEPGMPGAIPLASPFGAAADIWTWSLKVRGAEVRALASILSREERERADAFIFEEDRDAFIVARGQMRCILGRYLGILPDAVCFDLNAQGKPLIDTPTGHDLHFNLSHTSGRAVLAVSRRGEVGVDIELIRPLGEPEDWEFLSEDEHSMIAGLASSLRLPAAFQIWTRKEALLKALGCGLTLAPAEITVLKTPQGPIRPQGVPCDLGSHAWTIHDLDVPAGYAGAVAMRDVEVSSPALRTAQSFFTATMRLSS